MSKKYEMIKLFYIREQWTESMVRNAVVKGYITEEECEEILSSKKNNGVLLDEYKETK